MLSDNITSAGDVLAEPANSTSFLSKPTDFSGGITGSFHPLPFLFKDAGPGMVAETGTGTLYAYKRVELEVDLTEPLHNLLDDLLPHSQTDLDDVVLLMCGRKQLSLSTTFQDFTYQDISGTRAKVKLDLLWNPNLRPDNRAGGRLTGGQTIINIDDLYRIVDEADPLYWLNTNASDNTQSGVSSTTNSATLLDSQYSKPGYAHQRNGDGVPPAVSSSKASTILKHPPLSPPNSGAQLISPPTQELSAEDAMMLDDIDAERNHRYHNVCDDVVQQRDLVSVASGNASGNCNNTAAAIDADASTAALTPSSGAGGSGSVGEGGRRSRGSHRSGASFCGSIPSSTGNALSNIIPDTFFAGVNEHPTPMSIKLNTENEHTVAGVSRKRQRKPSRAQQLPPFVKTEESSEPISSDFTAVSDTSTENPLNRRRSSGKRPRRSVPASTNKAWQPVGLDTSSSPSPVGRIKSASPSADCLMSVSRMFSSENETLSLGGTTNMHDHHNQLFQFSSSTALLSPRTTNNNIVVEPREVHTASSSLSSSAEEDRMHNSISPAATIKTAVAAGSKPVAKKRRTNKKLRKPVAAANAVVDVVKTEQNLSTASNGGEEEPAYTPVNRFDPNDPENIVTPCGIVKKKRTIGANSYYAYCLGQTFDAVGKNIQLWQYLLELLMDPTRYQQSIEWMDPTGTFTLKEPERVAFLWGERKGSKKRKSEQMSYENMSRALRYYYGEILDKVPSKQFTYRFINLRDRIGHESDELFAFARSRAVAVGLQLPSAGLLRSSADSTTPSTLLVRRPSSQPSELPQSPSTKQEFTFSVDENVTKREISPRLLTAEVDKPREVTGGDGGENAKARPAKRTNTKRKKTTRPKLTTKNDAEHDVQHQQTNNNGCEMKVETTPEPASYVATAAAFSKPSLSSASSATTTTTTTAKHYSLPIPTSMGVTNGPMAHAPNISDMRMHFAQFPVQQQQQQRCSPAAMMEMMRNGLNNNNGVSPQNLNFLLQQLAANSGNNNINNSGFHPSAAAATGHFGLVPSSLEETLLQQQQHSQRIMLQPPQQQQLMLGTNNNQIAPTSSSQAQQMLAQLFQQHQQNFAQQQQNSNNTANRNGLTNCITLPGVGTINLASLMPQQQQIAPNNNNNPLNNPLIAAILAASGGGGGSGPTNVADGMRHLLAKVTESGSQVNQLMAAVGLATLLSSAQQQQPAQIQAPPSNALMNSNTIAQVLALLQQQQQQQQLQLPQQNLIPASSSGFVGSSPSAPASTCPPFMGLFGLRS